jgi:hypothetical protein
MLRHAHFYIKGGNRTFAAVTIKVCNAGQSGLVQARLMLTQKNLACAASLVWQCSIFHQSGHSILSRETSFKSNVRGATQQPERCETKSLFASEV